MEEKIKELLKSYLILKETQERKISEYKQQKIDGYHVDEPLLAHENANMFFIGATTALRQLLH